ncbi:hypothetical protein [Nitratireductor alexandrii]|uniref:hypothetical protein n=1 Tax=Nitratireductor alexandrii TaxID=2448161 RepID=UPI000FDCD9E3|nr:hypothetical protein [Nitratireductor alexandrii]
MGSRARAEIVFTVNGPGEVSGWLYPLASALKDIAPDVRITAAVVPCVFSSGSESDVIRQFSFVDGHCTIAASKALITRNRTPPGIARDLPGLVFHLGGDRYLTWLIAKRLGRPCYAYLEARSALEWRFERIFYSGLAGHENGASSPKETAVGELMVDAARLRCPHRAAHGQDKTVIALYPGSRDYIAKYILPFYGAVADLVSRERPDIEWVLAKSDYLSLDFLARLPDIDDGRPLDAVGLDWQKDGDGARLLTPGGNAINIVRPADAAARARLALTLPGSNTAELAALGLPMLVTLPTYWAETSPMPGLAGHIGRLPLAGKYIKRALGHAYLRTLSFTAHPNRRAGRMVTPEIVGRLTAAQVAAAMLDMLGGDLAAIETGLRAAMGEPGAARRIAEALVADLAAQAA